MCVCVAHDDLEHAMCVCGMTFWNGQGKVLPLAAGACGTGFFMHGVGERWMALKFSAGDVLIQMHVGSAVNVSGMAQLQWKRSGASGAGSI